jgi:hypothetical protein
VQKRLENNTPDWLKKLRKDVLTVYWSLDEIDRIEHGKSLGLRCHESARVFQNILLELGNENIEVIDGRFVNLNNKGMTHSWVEKIFDSIGSSVLIETTPNNPFIYPVIDKSDIIEKMVILPWDKRISRYEPSDTKIILDYIKQKNEPLKVKQIEDLIEKIIAYLRQKNYLKLNTYAQTDSSQKQKRELSHS